MFIYLDLLHYGYLEGVREFIVHFFFFCLSSIFSPIQYNIRRSLSHRIQRRREMSAHLQRNHRRIYNSDILRAVNLEP